MAKASSRSAILRMHCSDQKGLVAAVTQFVHRSGGNIIDLDEHVDRQEQLFFMRLEWELEDFSIAPEEIGTIFQSELADRFGMEWTLDFSDTVHRVAIFVSKLPHCLYDLLSRFQSGEWRIEVPLIVSNHEDLEPVATQFGIPFHALPVTQSNKREQEQKQIALLDEHRIDLVVLARYMQILSAEFVARFPTRIINIHHSFLPAFPGGKPYHSAHERGVKIIGATSHYVTADLDAGPIIEQDVVHVSHRDSVRDLILRGRDLEKVVLARAVSRHIHHATLVRDNRTIVFD